MESLENHAEVTRGASEEFYARNQFLLRRWKLSLRRYPFFSKSILKSIWLDRSLSLRRITQDYAGQISHYAGPMSITRKIFRVKGTYSSLAPKQISAKEANKLS